MLVTSIFSFFHNVFYTISKTNSIIRATFQLSSANASNLASLHFCLLVKLTFNLNKMIKLWSKLRAFADNRAVTIHSNIWCTKYFFPDEYVSYLSVQEPNIGEFNINNPECLLLSQPSFVQRKSLCQVGKTGI